MSEMQVSIRAEAFLARLRAAPERLQKNLGAVVQRLSIQLQTLVKQKLNGPVLHVRTGTLRRSINRLIEESAQAIFAKVGTNVRYAAPWEYGFTGDVPVRAHARRTRSGGVADVRAHMRHVVMPERSFLRSSLNDMKPRIEADVRKAAMEALRQ